ncbi:DNA-binding FadR family transcriptional regulator [Sinorhizobium fredii]|jgi:GntR family transcriptional regulator, sialic acid-inducible nan operon repressor|uniref:Transcriptional regulator NanR n=1 Tax=Sinorhizobium fredii (strain USDA 257) TaxID=1185652 RepID=I3X652_SINF2|nr:MULTISPECIES: transcriptional regulator NanR [Sinorhizobium]AFL51358.1 transcriptional regulator NanR [Sinorhizobium fredii USDA 257]PDT81674.1 transcriptional regulator NanR [Sinorhizobium sp. BJ1]
MSTLAIRKKLSDEVRFRLEEMIREEIYPLGTTLPSERDLMEMFGVGRPSIREALFALERMGLVKINTGERAKVTRPTPDHFLSSLAGAARMLLGRPEGVANFEQARLFLEESCARHLAANATAAQIEAIEAALARNEAAIGKARAFAMTDVAFHRTLTEMVSNPIFLAVHDAFVDWLIAQRPLPVQPEISNRESFEEHVAIVEAIRTGEPERAGRAMREHLESAARKYRQTSP